MGSDAQSAIVGVVLSLGVGEQCVHCNAGTDLGSGSTDHNCDQQAFVLLCFVHQPP